MKSKSIVSQIIGTVILFFVLNSCASLVNTNYTTVNIYTLQDCTRVCTSADTTKYVSTPAALEVKRSKQPLVLTLKNPYSTKTVTVQSKLNYAFLLGNFFNCTLPYGYLIDLTNNRRFTYPKNILVDMENFSNTNYNYKPEKSLTPEGFSSFLKKKYEVKQGTAFIELSTPQGNYFYINDNGKYADFWGCSGIIGRIGYYYTAHKFIVSSTGYVLNAAIFSVDNDPFPGNKDVKTLLYNISHGHDYGRVLVYYGFNYSKYTLEQIITTGTIQGIEQTKLLTMHEEKIGGIAGVQYKLFNRFRVGLAYAPAFATLNKKSNNEYTHTMYLEILFNLEFKPGK